jgi:hypothetical protein
MKSLVNFARGGMFAVLFLAGDVAFAASAQQATLDPANFTDPVANPYFPLAPGTTFSFETQTDEGLVRTEVTVTSQTRTIQTVDAIVVHDVVQLDRTGTTYLLEDTQDWYAPDNFGNVWYLGESTVAYSYDDNWNPIGTSTEGSWEAGVNEAAAGIIMQADPKTGLAYRQELAAGVAEDLAKVQSLNAKVSVPYGDFSNVLVTKEWTPLEPGSVEYKYYAAGVGLVLVKELKGKGTVREELVNIVP